MPFYESNPLHKAMFKQRILFVELTIGKLYNKKSEYGILPL